MPARSFEPNQRDTDTLDASDPFPFDRNGRILVEELADSELSGRGVMSVMLTVGVVGISGSGVRGIDGYFHTAHKTRPLYSAEV